MSGSAVETAVAALAGDCGLGELAALERLPGGSNNRAYRARVGERDLFVKEYFRDPADPRDRLGAEFGFSTFAWRHGVRALAEPLASDTESAIALFDYVAGRTLTDDDVDDARVEEALAFFAKINAHRGAEEACALPTASEACFAIDDHVATVSARVARLQAIAASTDIERAAQGFVSDRLNPAWSEAAATVERASASGRLGPRTPIDASMRCLSPSDFGFHNALLGPTGELVFHDFEYAGWDDPVKLVCDFFCQVGVPAPRACASSFADSVSELLGLHDWHRHRIDVLMPAFRVKWCCIVLNEFVSDDQRRRRFAHGDDGTEQRKREQLAKAEALLAETVEH